MEQTLKDQIAVVTGGNAGIGKAIALELAGQGAHVAIFANNEERGALVVSEIEGSGGSASFHQVDVSDAVQATQGIQAIVKEHGRVDILVNNAGITRDGLLLRMKEEDWDTVIKVNLNSCFNTSKAVLRAMMKQRSGKIINLTSIVGLTGNA